MTFTISPDVFNLDPKFLIAFSIAKGVEVFGSNNDTNKILTDIYPKVIEKYSLDSLSSHPNSQAYINFSKKIGISPDSAFLPYLQIKRILKGKSVGNINNIVNQYMVMELLYNLSLAAYDLDTIRDEIIIGISRGGEKLTPIGGTELTIKPNDLVFSDAKGVLYSFSEGYRDSSKITNHTTSVLFAIDAPAGIEKSLVEEAIRALSSKFNSNKYMILDSSNSKGFMD